MYMVYKFVHVDNIISVDLPWRSILHNNRLNNVIIKLIYTIYTIYMYTTVVYITLIKAYSDSGVIIPTAYSDSGNYTYSIQ